MSERPVLVRSFTPHRIKDEYRRVAWFYDWWGQITEDKAVKRLLELAAVKDGSFILEVAVGTGRLFAELAALNPAGHNEGIELSTDMLDKAKSRMDKSARGISYRLQEADAYDLPFDDGSFDYLFNAYMLDLLPEEDFPRILREFDRVLKPGGKIALASFSFGSRKIHRAWYWLAKYAPSLLTGCRPVQLESALETSGFNLLCREEISQNTFPSAILLAEKPATGG